MERVDPSRDDSEAQHEAWFSTDQYYRISDSGVLDGYAKTELHDGRIVVVNAQYFPHGGLKSELAFALRDAVKAAGLPLRVVIGTDVEIVDGEVLQPDLTILDDVKAPKGIPVRHVRLIVEVAASTEHVDLSRKRLRYAEAGVPEYWVAVLATQRFERFAEPAGGDYRRHDRFPIAAGCTSLSLLNVRVAAGAVSE